MEIDYLVIRSQHVKEILCPQGPLGKREIRECPHITTIYQIPSTKFEKTQKVSIKIFIEFSKFFMNLADIC